MAHLRKLIAAQLILGAAALLTVPAAAQTVPTPAAPATPAKEVVVEEKKASAEKESETLELEKVEVTGSRIRTLVGEQTAMPVYTLDRVELEHRGVTRLADIRLAIPQLAGAVGFNDNLQNSGTSRAQTVGTSFNLRGLGGNSTLVLVDGRRISRTGQEAPGGAGGREDFSVDGLPISAIERIEVLPQGAGAIYGSEAIAGVINIVLKKNYTGAEVNLTYDNTFDTDVGQTTVSVTGGYRAGKLSTFFTASYEKQNGLASRDRWYTATADPRAFGATTTNFLFSVPSGAGTLSTNSSPAATAGANLPGLTTHVVGIPTGSNGSTAANAGYTMSTPPLYDSAQYTMSIDPAARRSVVFKGDYEFASWLKPYAQARWSRFESEFVGAPVTLSTTLPVGYAGNPFSVPVFLRKVFYDLPLPQTRSRQENSGFIAGVEGNFLDNWRYDAGFSFARNVVTDDAIAAGAFNNAALTAAINNPDPALRPILAYDSTRVANPALIAAALFVFDHKDTTDTTQYTVQADGPVWSGWAGDVVLAVGAEAGGEKVKFYRDPGDPNSFVLKAPFSRDTTATFAEVTVPLLSEKQKIPLVHRLEIGGAVRATDYSDVGGITTPSARALLQPVKWLTLRGSYAEGFKPVRLYDLLGPVTVGVTTLTVASNVRDNLRGGELVVGTFTRSFGGNPTLRPEESVSRNAGVVLDVPFVKGLSLSADFYDLQYTDRSGGPGNQVLFDFFPERVTRAAPTAADLAAGYAGVITTWDATNINLAGVTTKGWDYRLTYQNQFGFGNLMISVAYSNPDVTFTKATPAAVPNSTFGHQPEKVSGSIFWTRGVWDAGLSVNYQARYYINGLTATSYPEYYEFNPQVSYNFDADHARFNAESPHWWARALAGAKLTVTVINAFDRDPDFIDAANGRNVMDPRLRRYIVSLSKKF